MCQRRTIENNNNPTGSGDAVMAGKINLWGRDFDTFLSGIMSGNSAINSIEAELAETSGREIMYDLYGRQVPADTAKNGAYIVKKGQKAIKIIK